MLALIAEAKEPSAAGIRYTSSRPVSGGTRVVSRKVRADSVCHQVVPRSPSPRASSLRSSCARASTWAGRTRARRSTPSPGPREAGGRPESGGGGEDRDPGRLEQLVRSLPANFVPTKFVHTVQLVEEHSCGPPPATTSGLWRACAPYEPAVVSSYAGSWRSISPWRSVRAHIASHLQRRHAAPSPGPHPPARAAS
jgi:hypothetical protein